MEKTVVGGALASRGHRFGIDAPSRSIAVLLVWVLASGCSDPAPSVSSIALPIQLAGDRLIEGSMNLQDGTVLRRQRVVTSEGQVVDRYFSADGSSITAEDLRLTTEEAAQSVFRQRGAMTAELASRSGHMAATDTIRVVGWLALHQRPSDRNRPGTDDATPELERSHEQLRGAFTRHNVRESRIDARSPLVRATVTRSALEELARSGLFMQLEPDPGEGSPLWTTWHPAVKADTANSAGWTGFGRRVAMLEGGQPDNTSELSGILATASPSGYTDSHIRLTTGVVRKTTSPMGIAPSVGILIANWGSFPGPGSTQQWAIDNGADVINFSWSFNLGFNGPPGNHDLYHDWLILRPPYSMFVVAAGNDGAHADPTRQFVQNRSYNGLVVGASSDANTAARSDDTIAAFSSWMNPSASGTTDRELPEIVAPGVCVDSAGPSGGCQPGTSFATPMVSGAIALLRERNPFNLSSGNWPEAQKAILMATADCDVNGVRLNLTDSTDDRDGVGLLNVNRAITLGDPANANFTGAATTQGFRYGSFSFPGSFSGGNWTTVPRVQTSSSGWISIVLAWDATPTCPSSSTCTGVGPDADMNLLLLLGGKTVASSVSFNNNYEVIIAQLSPNTDYDVRVQLSTYQQTSTYYGLAWSTFDAGCP
jgi:Subtilase family